MARAAKKSWRSLLIAVQRRVPAGQQFVQEAFTSDHRRPVMVKLNDAWPDIFYWFDEPAACAFFDAVVDWAMRQSTGRLTVSYTAAGEVQAQAHRLQLAASKLDEIRVLSVGEPGREIRLGARLECANTAGSPLARYRLAMAETPAPVMFVAREEPRRTTAQHSLGFVTCDADVIEELADEVEGLLRGQGRRLRTFERLEKLHETTQQVARELESYSRRMELAVQRARRRPDLLTPARFERIVTQAIAKMEELKDIPRRALRTIGSSKRR